MNETVLPGVRQFDMKGKTAIITGGSKGLGYAMAAGLASAGADVILVNRNLEEGEAAAKKIRDDFDVRAKSYAADVTEIVQMEEVAAKVVKEFGAIDVLINSAGITIRGAIDDLSPDEFKKVMIVNVEGTWNASRAVTPYMKANKGGRIINIASTLGLVGLANRTPYASSKGAVVQMTRALGLELAPFNINVNAICPGPFLTEMNVPIGRNT